MRRKRRRRTTRMVLLCGGEVDPESGNDISGPVRYFNEANRFHGKPASMPAQLWDLAPNGIKDESI